MISFNFKNTTRKHYYVKFIPIYFDAKELARLRSIGQFLGIIISTALIAYILLQNLAPLGVTMTYTYDPKSNNITDLGPKTRLTTYIQNNIQVIRQTGDYIYFKTKMPYNFDQATLRLTFNNSSPEQTVSVGFQDQDSWHYSTIPYDVPFLNNISWPHIGSGPILYQKIPKFKSIDEFISNTPKDGIIGTYGIDTDFWNVSYINSQDYQPQKGKTIINTPLRGRHVIYAYLQNEPFNMTILKQDLNWYDGPDLVDIKVYKGNSLVYETQGDDDGIQNNSKILTSPEEIKIDSPGPGYPEPGVYKIIINATGDTIIKQITTNLHKIVFDGSIFLAGNSQIYPGTTPTTIPTTLYTDALSLSAITYHDAGKQTIMVNNSPLTLNEMSTDKILIPSQSLSQITVPKNDVLLRGFLGYFAFEKSQYFRPTQYYILPLAQSNDLNLVDYIYTNYTPSYHTEGWQYAEHTFDLRTAYINNDQLSWVIQAPNLEANNRNLLIKSISITMSKNSWF